MIDFSKNKYTIYRDENDKVIALLKKHSEYKAGRGFILSNALKKMPLLKF